MSVPWLAALGARWMRFENLAFAQFMRVERWVRSLPRHVQLRPSAFDRKVFRVFCGVFAALLLVTTLPSRGLRAVAILCIIAVLFVIATALALRNTRS